ncbi:hypothetical protein BS78_06G220900 [Paspalum vaginatum]|nr:hypothetical protein BS78_06G220900 [Paspalum vaginatum]
MRRPPRIGGIDADGLVIRISVRVELIAWVCSHDPAPEGVESGGRWRSSNWSSTLRTDRQPVARGVDLLQAFKIEPDLGSTLSIY